MTTPVLEDRVDGRQRRGVMDAAWTIAFAGLLGVVVPLSFVGDLTSPLRSANHALVFALCVFSAARLGALLGSRRRQYLTITFYLFVYIWFGLAAVVQLDAEYFHFPEYFLGRGFDGSTRLTATAIIWVGVVAYEVGMRIGRPARVRPARRQLDAGRVHLLAVAGLVSSTLALLVAGSVSVLFTNREEFYSTFGTRADGGYVSLAADVALRLPILVAAILLVYIYRQPGGLRWSQRAPQPAGARGVDDHGRARGQQHHLHHPRDRRRARVRAALRVAPTLPASRATDRLRDGARRGVVRLPPRQQLPPGERRERRAGRGLDEPARRPALRRRLRDVRPGAHLGRVRRPGRPSLRPAAPQQRAVPRAPHDLDREVRRHRRPDARCPRLSDTSEPVEPAVVRVLRRRRIPPRHPGLPRLRVRHHPVAAPPRRRPSVLARSRPGAGPRGLPALRAAWLAARRDSPARRAARARLPRRRARVGSRPATGRRIEGATR